MEIYVEIYFDRLTCTEHKLHHLLRVERGVTYDLRNQNTYPLPLTGQIVKKFI